MSKPFRPMLAAEADIDTLRFPLFATPKLDGVRALIFEDGVYSRSMKKIPNKRVQEAFTHWDLVGFDGELILGDPTAPDVYRKTQSACARADSSEQPVFHVFDRYDMPGVRYDERMISVDRQFQENDNPHIDMVPHWFVDLPDKLALIEESFLIGGYEGLILRAPEGLYKNGRSTAKEQGMLKLKRFVDSEATIIAVEEEMHNGNDARTDALGHTERSSHKANLVGKDRMGALFVRDLKSGVEFKIGTGFTAADREMFWRTPCLGGIVKYKSFLIGVKDKPRFPSYLGLREDFDL